MVSETKIDSSFSVGNFVIDGFSTPYRLDRDRNGGGIMLNVREVSKLACHGRKKIRSRVFMWN